MAPIFESQRLFFREFQLKDAEDLYQLNLDWEVIKYTGDPPFKSVEEARLFIENYDHYKKNGFGRWAVISRDNQRLVGWCGLKRNELDLIDLGFRYFKKDWGKGYATESALASLNHGFTALHLDEIMGRAAQDNLASIRVLEKIGMEYWKKDSCKGIDNSVYYRISRKKYVLLQNSGK